jgi:hypothetical protein
MCTVALILQAGPDPAAIRHVVLMMMAIMPLIVLLILAIVILPFWFICKKAGFSPWLSLLNVIPLGNLVLIYVLAFSDWKVMPLPVAMGQPQYPYPPQPPVLPQG